jgi:hypothetical protein
MSVLILFRNRVVVGLCLDARALLLFIYAFPLIQIARKCYTCIYRFCSSFSIQLESNGCC